MASNNLGAFWYLFGEPNRYPDMTGDKFAFVFNYYKLNIELGDSTAKIVGPSLLNWDYTCVGCDGFFVCNSTYVRGYECGKEWFEDFIDTYEATYGSKPSVHAWAIDVYPLDWVTTPNNASHAEISINQIKNMRAYLNQINEYQNTPIWITELGLHIGYESYIIDSGTFIPVGNYRWDVMADYLIKILDWLEENSEDYDISRWFFFVTYKNIINIEADGYMGITFFNSLQPNSINCLGMIYKSYAMGTQKLTCDEQGNSIPQ